ncbi:hypothetical protein TNCV_1682041 [Trichonephila clavipes]|nr:hypothetical protein TNCV_1682041 [Trichonephila clavipes]
MTSHNRSGDPLRGRAVGKFEAGQSQAEAARSLQVDGMLSPGYGINFIQERQDICGAENISRGYHKNGGVFFSMIIRNFLDKGILVESSSRVKVELSFNPPAFQ